MKRRVGSLSGSAYVSEGKSDSTSPSSAAKVRAAHFSDDLAQLMTSSERRSTEAGLEAALLESPPNPLKIHAFLIQSSILGVLVKALSEVDSNCWKLIASHFFVCDLATMKVSSPELMGFRLADKTANALAPRGFQ
ncbi:hypothetical protein AB1Y20_011363 [Prymnesium parvum]|uniref:Uncharacterized protein n=1 Tax=Prymnesium parvum TaxID=97485 RepID=A0AB34ILM4_PRYPA